ncbi:MAG: MotA/TolQ/ExbB proton channel family protein [Planctomycetes bacterium]|nr:MotA/TolQ/ExbB proton channel family protein [Planctomycetota bacterium]
MRTRLLLIPLLWLASLTAVLAEDVLPGESYSFAQASQSLQGKLDNSLAILSNLREWIASEKIPLSQNLNKQESDLTNVRLEYEQVSRLLDNRTLDLSNLRLEIKSRREESAYLSNLLSEYVRNFESRLQIAEIQRYQSLLERAKLAAENSNLSELELFAAQVSLVTASLDRLHDALGGTSFQGTAVDASGLVKNGKFVMVGPAALFMSENNEDIGTAEQRLGSLEPAIIRFGTPEDSAAAKQLVSASQGLFPLDPTLGNAHKIESTEESLWEHIQKGGAVMVPILALAGTSLLVAIYKYLSLVFIPNLSQKRFRDLLASISKHNEESARQQVKSLKGPAGKMLAAGVEHLREPRELIEEIMYETVLATRLKLQRFLPYIAISAASAPLLGLLGTVTGIIATFKLITVFGSGDVKTLSGGISEALITTEFGLIVAIPSLLLHAFLSRKASSIIDQMEKAGVAFINQISKTPFSNFKNGSQNRINQNQSDNNLNEKNGDIAKQVDEILDDDTRIIPAT